ncbi:uncharacterized protein LOC144180603 [Haemaphysalis longicornis]
MDANESANELSGAPSNSASQSVMLCILTIPLGEVRVIFFLQTLTVNTVNSRDYWSATVNIEGQPMMCKLDTGANCSIISRRDVEKLPGLPEEACQVALTSFFGHKSTSQAKVRLRLSANDRVVPETFYIVDQSVPEPSSGSAAERLGFIVRVWHIDVDQLYPPAQPFAEIFTGLGELKDYEYEIKLKPGAVGVVVPARRVPVALENMTRAELQRMEEQGVITKPEVRYLGHILTTEGLRLDPERVQDILSMSEPKNASEPRLKSILAATNNDPVVVELLEYAVTSWPDSKHEVPEAIRTYWSYQEEIHAQDGLLFCSNKSPLQRLMGRQTRTLLPVPTSHLVPEVVPNRAVHNRLQEIRQRQRIYYNRGSRNLPPLSPGQRVTAYDTHEKTWTPAVFLRPPETPRSLVVKTEEGQELRRTREHLREAPPPLREESPPATPAGSEQQDDAQPAQELRRSTRARREPCHYPQPEKQL